jgi:general secretion pathway protein G
MRMVLTQLLLGKTGRSATRGFTLLEIVMVVTILGALGGIVAASIGSPTEDNRETALSLTLREFRAQLGAYALQHRDVPPDGARLMDVLLQKTDVAGQVGNGGHCELGPYLMALPQNPYSGRTDVKVVPAGEELRPDDTSGWL